jgi:hypothetical protein
VILLLGGMLFKVDSNTFTCGLRQLICLCPMITTNSYSSVLELLIIQMLGYAPSTGTEEYVVIYTDVRIELCVSV